jgi:hypothetical protein
MVKRNVVGRPAATVMGFLLGLVISAPTYAEGLIFGNSGLNPSNGLSITTSTGNYFVSNSDSGWWNSDFYSNPDNTNYAVGFLNKSPGPGTINYNNFFTFDLSQVSGTVISANLTLYVTNVSPTRNANGRPCPLGVRSA